ncbi:MAG: hypothetical protein EBX59_09110 [Betaproteobacteria bacterium]|nr:hypothetical protein [Betaproteobacteria bacterium]
MTSQVIEGGAPSRGRAFLASFLKNILPAVPLLLIVGFFFLFPKLLVWFIWIKWSIAILINAFLSIL